MTYRDKTFCSGDGCAKFSQCPRALTEQVKQLAKAAGLLIGQWAEPRLLDCYEKPQTAQVLEQQNSENIKEAADKSIIHQRLVRPELRFKSATNEWPTPNSLWKPLDDEFGFTLDVCSTHENAKCANHFTIAEDGLKQPWSGVAWMNPPYGAQLARWVKKCHDEAKRGALVVGLIPVRSNTSYWHDYIMGNEIRFIRGYPKFGNAKQGLKAPLAVVIWRPSDNLASG